MELLSPDAIQKLEDLSDDLETRLKRTIKRFQIPVFIARVASMVNVHFKDIPPINYATTVDSQKELMDIMHIKLLNKGIFIAPRGLYSDDERRY